MSDKLTCPYCTKSYAVDSEDHSDDHIFSNFLGGKRKIPACRDCNSYFGGDFEGRTSHNIATWYTIMNGWGINFNTKIPDWKGAKTDKGDLNLQVTEFGIKATLARPIIEKNEDGSYKTFTYGVKKEAEKNLKNLIAKGLVEKSAEVVATHGIPEEATVNFSFDFSNDLYRLVLKMCSSVATLLPDFNLHELDISRQFLIGAHKEGPVSHFRYSFETFDEFNEISPPMAHSIYVERNEAGTFGLVQFFGIFQFVCKLGASEVNNHNTAIFAFLDPITGKEDFQFIKPINLNKVPSALSVDERIKNVNNWISSLHAEAEKRGASKAETKVYKVNIIE